MNSTDNDMKNDMDAMIWKRIKKVADEKGITMVSLSTGLGKSVNYMSTMYYGNAKIPCSLLIDIAKILNVPAEYLLTGNNTSVFDDEAMLRKMVMFVASDENLLTQSELRVVYSTMLDMIGKHYNAVEAMKRIKAEETISAYSSEFEDPDCGANEPKKPWFFPTTNTGDKGKNNPKK